MTKNRSYSIAFKRQVAEEYLAGAAPSVLGKRHDLCRNLVRIWVRKYEAGEYDDDARAADTARRSSRRRWRRSSSWSAVRRWRSSF